LARSLRAQPQHRHIGIVFAAAPSDEFDEQDARNAGADAILRKPFEASALLSAVQRLAAGLADRKAAAAKDKSGLDRASIRAAVTLALDAAMPSMIDELTERVMLVLSHRS
jgi:DNA-binding response OmpR family regulator